MMNRYLPDELVHEKGAAMASDNKSVITRDLERIACTDGGEINLDPATRADVQRVASGIYDFLAATRRLGERPNQRLEISQSEMEILHFVSRHPGCGVSDIARLRFLRPSNVSATVRRLLDNDLLHRENNAHDRRAQDLYISKNGSEMLTRVSEHWGDIISRIVSTMDTNDVRVLINAVPSLLKLTQHSEVFVEEHQRRQQTL